MTGELRIRVSLAAAILAGLALATSGCSEAPPPQTLVSGSVSTLRELAGEWRGEYWSAESGRSGTLRFTLAAQADGSAAGEVIMVLDPRRRSRGDEPAMPVVQPLAIRFVAMANGAIRGALEPYDDPECGCSLATTFTGEWRGDRVSGGFSSRGGDGHPTRSGRWRARRLRGEVGGR